MPHVPFSLLGGGIIPRGLQETVFNQMFWVFTAIGSVVGAVVIGYLLWQTYQYRAGEADVDEEDVSRPVLGELPGSTGGGRHLLFSFSISTIVVLLVIAWSYGSLLYLEDGVHDDPPENVQDRMDVTVVGHQFYWEFDYHNASGRNRTLTTQDEFRVPRDALVNLEVTSADVFHNFGIPKLKIKTDAIPGQTTPTWLVADRTGTYMARCYELCGAGHSEMTAKVIVMDPGKFDEWYATQANNSTQPNNSTQTDSATPTGNTTHAGNSTQTSTNTTGA